MSVTSKDVARKAGVSPSTVSRVVADHPKISDETKRKVKAVMQELGYHTNAIARSLVNRSTNTIGVIMPKSAYLSIANPFFPEVLRGISACANEKGFYVLLSVEGNNEIEIDNVKKIVKTGLVDGAIMLYSRVEDETLKMLVESKFPFVMVGKPTMGNDISYVDNDNIAAAYEATNHLISKGKKSIGLITGPLNFVVSLDRLQGYKRALKDNGIEFKQELVKSMDYTQENGYNAMEEFINEGKLIDSILATDDLFALGAIKAIKKAKLQIPKDIGIISFNNIPFADEMCPSLTSVDIHPYELGYEATDLLFQSLENKNHISRARIVSTKLIIRESCS